jgi:hypothetical protein
MAALDAEHRMMLDGIRFSLREITDTLTEWADEIMEQHGPDSSDPDPIALAVNLRTLTDLARDAAQARDHLARMMAPVVRAHPATFAEPIEGVGLLKVGADSTRHEWDDDALRSKLAGTLTADDNGEPRSVADAVAMALRCAGGSWRVTGLRALGIDVDHYRTTTRGTPKTRIEGT